MSRRNLTAPTATPTKPTFARQVDALPATVPFVGPETLERLTGVPITLRLGANESPFGVSPKAAEAMKRAVAEVAWYGDAESSDLRQALSAIHDVPMNTLCVGSGIDELLGQIARAFLNPGDAVVTSLGAYPTFDYHVTGFGGQLHFVPYTEGWMNNLDGLATKARATSAKLVYLANPDNPTGTYYGRQALEAFILQLPADTTLLLDEAYVEFADEADVLPMDYSLDKVIRLRTFSKAYGMAGARIGYTVAHPATTATFDKIRLHFGVNRPAQAGALAALTDTAFIAAVRTQVQAGRSQLAQLARELGYHPVPSSTSFMFIDVGSEPRARQTTDRLLERGVFIRSPGAPRLNQGIRITIGRPDQMPQLMSIWKDVAASL